MGGYSVLPLLRLRSLERGDYAFVNKRTEGTSCEKKIFDCKQHFTSWRVFVAYIFQQYGDKHGGRYACSNRRYGGCGNEWQCDSLFASSRHNECLRTLDASSGAGRQTGAGLVLYFTFESLDDLVELSVSLLAQLPSA